jgi:F-type H+-transporting ATPase subunit b
MALLQNPEFWVGVAFLAFIGLLWRFGAFAAIGGALDSRGQKIQAQLDEATQLRQEAETLLAQIKVQHEESERSAAALMENARNESVRLQAEAKVKLEEQIQRRAALAERKIATAESQATAEVKAAAADLATQTAERVLAARLAIQVSDPLVDAAIGDLRIKLQ